MARTVAKVIEYLQTLKQDEYIAVPFIWDKSEAEQWQETELTDEQWQEAIDLYENDDEMNNFSTTVMAEVLPQVITPEV